MKKLLLTLTLLIGLSGAGVFAQDAPAEAVEAVVEAAAEAAPEDENRADYDALLAAQKKDGIDYAYAFDFFTVSMLWTVIAAAMVFIMHLGFATLETGLTQSKNTVNILFKNVFIICIGLLTYAVTGFATHYPGDFNGWIKLGGMIGDLNADGGDTFGYGGLALAMTGFGDFIFQAMFAATAATIVSGAVAERVKLLPFLIFATLLVGLAYPIVGSWHWGGGWMGSLNGGNGFKDFAGSAVVHAFGGFAALACVMLLGPRRGKYVGGKIRPIPGHNMPLAAVGVFLLFFGWFGFNGGSVLSASPGPLGLVFTTTALAAAAGGLSASVVSWVVLKKPDLSMALNGILAGLVGITANADIVSPGGSIVIGLIAGLIVFFSVLFFDKIKIDDPVGAISVHGVCGVWGILACALFDTTDSGFTIVGQMIGVIAVAAAAFIFSLVVFGIIKAVMGIRVSEEEEAEGLDIGEHGMEAYPHFQTSGDR
ncbi:MAG TPA: ammonium transporter [Verrucomicrobiae bacterium]|nr:ammonium transporter [Verrucomicrobiae bacterium]